MTRGPRVNAGVSCFALPWLCNSPIQNQTYKDRPSPGLAPCTPIWIFHLPNDISIFTQIHSILYRTRRYPSSTVIHTR